MAKGVSELSATMIVCRAMGETNVFDSSSGAGPETLQKIERSMVIDSKCEAIEAVEDLSRLLSDMAVGVEDGS